MAPSPCLSTFQGDCLEVMPTLPAASVNLVLCDPPYLCTAADWDLPLSLPDLWQEYARLLAPGGVVVLFGTQPFASALVASNPRWYRFELIWEKQKATGFLNAKKQPLRAHENILIFSPKAPTYYPQKSQGKPYNKGVRPAQTPRDIYNAYGQVEIKSEDGSRYPRSVVKFNTADAERQFPHLHRTQKPQKLLQYLIRTFSQEGDTVLDNTAGSFATGVASVYTGRNFIGIEKDPDFYTSGTDWLYREAGKLGAAGAAPLNMNCN